MPSAASRRKPGTDARPWQRPRRSPGAGCAAGRIGACPPRSTDAAGRTSLAPGRQRRGEEVRSLGHHGARAPRPSGRERQQASGERLRRGAEPRSGQHRRELPCRYRASRTVSPSAANERLREAPGIGAPSGNGSRSASPAERIQIVASRSRAPGTFGLLRNGHALRREASPDSRRACGLRLAGARSHGDAHVDIV